METTSCDGCESGILHESQPVCDMSAIIPVQGKVLLLYILLLPIAFFAFCRCSSITFNSSIRRITCYLSLPSHRRVPRFRIAPHRCIAFHRCVSYRRVFHCHKDCIYSLYRIRIALFCRIVSHCCIVPIAVSSSVVVFSNFFIAFVSLFAIVLLSSVVSFSCTLLMLFRSTIQTLHTSYLSPRPPRTPRPRCLSSKHDLPRSTNIPADPM